MEFKQEHRKHYETADEAAACLPVVEQALRQRCTRDLRTRCDDKRIDYDTCKVTFDAAAVHGTDVVLRAHLTTPE